VPISARMDGEAIEDGFEFNLTRVLESLDQRGPSLGELSAMAPPPEPLVITPLSDDQPEPLPHRVPTARGSQQTRRAPRAQRAAAAHPASTEPPLAAPPIAERPVAKPRTAEPLPTRAPLTALEAPTAPSSVFDAAAHGEARAALHRVPVDTDLAAAAAEPAPLLPSPSLPSPALPAAAVVPPAAVAAQDPVKMPTASEVRQFQSTQRRQAKKNSQGRVMGRVVLVLVLLAGAVAASLTVGRDYLFSDEWAAELDDPVAEVQAAKGAEFLQTVPLTDQAADEFAGTVSRVMLGDEPNVRISVWRALGVASGDIDPAAVGAALVTTQPAVFDPSNAQIARLAGTTADLRPMLAAALDHQLSDQAPAGLDLLGPRPVIGAPAADPGAADPGAADTPESADGVVATDPDPVAALPVTYQMRAAERLASALAVNPTAALDDQLGTAPEAALAPGDVPLAGPFGIGIDDWTLVWANRLPASSVDTLVSATTAESVRTFDRAGTTCVGAVFEAGNEMYAAALLLELGAWAAAAPVESQAAATQLAPTYVQLTTCDPGGAVVQLLNPAAADIVVSAQVARLNAAAAAAATTPAAATTIPAAATTAPAVAVATTTP
jgi:hypothetical protein